MRAWRQVALISRDNPEPALVRVVAGAGADFFFEIPLLPAACSCILYLQDQGEILYVRVIGQDREGAITKRSSLYDRPDLADRPINVLRSCSQPIREHRPGMTSKPWIAFPSLHSNSSDTPSPPPPPSSLGARSMTLLSHQPPHPPTQTHTHTHTHTRGESAEKL